jgi:transcriptional regulator with XRE-family HTH domain
MSDLERGEHNPTLTTLVKIAFGLGITLTEFAAELERLL